MIPALVVTASAMAFAGLLFAGLFDFIDPKKVSDDYDPCGGGWEEAEMHDCKLGLLHIPQQPINTYSNLAYLATGIFLHAVIGSDASLVFALTMAYLATGSTLFHATSTKWAGMLDVTAIYVVFAAVGVYAVSTLLDATRSPYTAAAMFVVAGLCSFAFSRRFKRRINLVLAISLGSCYVALLANAWIEHDWRAWPYMAASLGTFALAFLIWNLDKKRTFPLHGWGHGFWHVLTALASGFVFYAASLDR